ncbi:MAG: glycosyltransferase [Bryobacterales bacterium]|nr:glycosyltransferase [Bryobacterales bacterium]
MWIVWAACAIAATYQAMVIVAVLRHLLAKEPPLRDAPGVSILKPVRGGDPGFREAIGSHASIVYPDVELLFGVNLRGDPAPAMVRDLAASHPERRIEIHEIETKAPNGKVGVLTALSKHARKPVWVVNDGDIQVPPDYLSRILAPLADPQVGLVTCLYRANPRGLSASWEALGIAADFAPSTLVAPMVGVKEFGLGSTLCFRASDLAAAGGFAAIEDYLADDYQIARRLTKDAGKRAVLSKLIVETNMAYDSWGAMIRHQLRWARTIRVSRPDGYSGLPVTHAGLWALVAVAAGSWQVGAGVAVLRMLAGFLAGWVLMRSPQALVLPLIPLWDVFAFGIWVGGWLGDTVEWRGQSYRLRGDGRLSRR